VLQAEPPAVAAGVSRTRSRNTNTESDGQDRKTEPHTTTIGSTPRNETERLFKAMTKQQPGPRRIGSTETYRGKTGAHFL